MSCTFKITRNNLIDNLKLASQKHNVPLNNYITFIYGSINEDAELTDSFKTKLSEYLNVPIDKIDSQYIDLVVDYITDEYNKTYPDVNYYVDDEQDFNKISSYGYDSVYSREFAKHICLALTINASREIERKYGSIEKYIENVKNTTNKSINKLQAYTEFLRGKLIINIANRAEKRGIATKDEVYNLIKNKDIAKLEELFGNIHPEDNNLLATYKEFNANRNNFIEEVFRNSGTLRKLIYENKEDKEINIQEDIEDQSEEENSSISSEETDTVDNYIGNLTNKLGDVGDYMNNIDNDILLFFSSIYKLKSVNRNTDNTYQYDLDNPLGVPDTMDARQCINVIFSHANAYNVTSLKEEIKRIAKDVPGMEGLIQVADYMDSNPDFAFKLWRNFAKTIISKLETSNVSKNGFVARQSNFTVNKESVLKFDFINAFKITSITANKDRIIKYLNSINKIKKDIKDKYDTLKIYRKQNQIDKVNKEIDDLIDSAIVSLSKAFKIYFNTIQEQAIESYIRKSDDKLNAIDFLLGTLNDLNNIAINSEKKYKVLQFRIGELSNKIYELTKKIRDNSEALIEATASPYSGIDSAQLRKQNKEYAKEIESLTNKRALLYKEDFIDENFMGKIAPFARRIARFSYIKTDLNSRNVQGNLSSDLINNSMITNILNTLKNPIALANFGKYREQSRQYDFSNIMIEHRDEKGDIINYGLFTQDPISKELTPTPYAHRMLQEYLYSGIADVEGETGTLYEKMFKGDYMASAIFNFFKHETQYDDESQINDGGPSSFANYFMRIPSDAPKNFVIRAPKYSINGLFINDKINRNHVIYKQLRNAFVQEVQDAANALDFIFGDDVIDGSINPDVINKNIPTRHLYKNYHYKDKLFAKDKNGKYKLTGNVFHSDRFVLTTEENNTSTTVNYGELILDEAFDFFYGGASSLKAKRTDKGVEVVITPEQEEIIAKHLEEFIKAYCEQSYERANKYKHLFGNDTFDKNDLYEFSLNYCLTYIGFNDLFEGDSKFYKSSQDCLKRYKEVQGSGVALGILNYNDDLRSDRTPVENSALNKTSFTHKTIDDEGNIKEETVKITQYNRFRGVTIKNTVRTGDSIGTFKLGKNNKPAKFIRNKNGELIEDDNGNYVFEKIGRLSKKLIDALIDSGMSKKNAEIHAANIMFGYTNTKVNDAQSYITFEEWVRRIAAKGELEKYRPLIEAIYDETKPLDAKTISKFVQVQKNFYYDQYFNPKARIFASRQIKNAEFVLIPRLIKGTQLEEVYNMMKEAGVDQLNTEEASKAGKCNVLTIWDNDGNITEQNKQDFITNAKGAVELFNYNYLYTQQETPSHMNASNKAGVQFMKKIIDNINETVDGKPNPLWPLKQKFQKLYVENIRSSAEDFADELGISIDENGNFVVNEDSNIDIELFYNLLREEVSRQGLDSNAVDYVTLNEDGVPTMPTFMGNFHKKLESIVQSMINHRITRQTLPGFHAAQITNVGFKPLNEVVSKRSYSTELKYHPNQYALKTDNTVIISEREFNEKSKDEQNKYENIGAAPYIEIMIPKSSFNFKRTKDDGSEKTDEELIAELRESGLDTIIGYRIPTEGKQSICVMKVVGFIDDTYDSTIVVPDDWVAQTGSDFDIDSVYAITFTTTINKNGKITKIKYREVDPKDYIRYVKSKIEKQLKKEGINTSISDDLQKFVEEYNDDIQDKFIELQNRMDELYNTMKYKLQDIIKTLNSISVDGKTKKEKYINKLKYVIFNLNKEIVNNSNLSKKDIYALKLYNNVLKELYSFLSTQSDDFFEKKDSYRNEAYQNIIYKLNDEAVKNGLLDYETFVRKRSRTINRIARNNDILDVAIAIMQNPLSLEENLSRSNFDDIIESRDKIQSEHIKKTRANRSVYNFFDQADYQEDATSGMTLKGASVARDTFTSICNTTRPFIRNNSTIKVIYKSSDGYTKEQLQSIFTDVETNDNGDFIVTHNMLGWTLNNRNASNKLLTPYSSQTTAHILDNIKEGTIPNVNNYTFNVYKTFPDIGCDYNLAVAFMAQPVISRIVEANNYNKSVYSEKSGINPVKSVIVEIANKLMENTDVKFTPFSKISDIIKSISVYYASSLDYDLNGHVLDFNELTNRLNDNNDESIKNLLFDLKIALDFQHIKSLSNEISNNARVLRSDKFGAKQSVFETINTINEIESLRTSDNSIYIKNEDNTESTLMDVVYPNTNKESLYPTLNAFYIYSTKFSVQLARLIFDTHKDDFDELLFSIEDVIKGNIDDESYNDFRNYVFNYIYTNTTAIKCTPKLDEKGNIVFDTTSDRRKELARIYGLGKGVNIIVEDEYKTVKEFDVEDINHPTKDEIKQFITLSPAQKIHYIKSKFDKKGIFEYIEESLSGRGDNKNKHTLLYKENSVDIETIYNEFEKAFFSSNPLIKLAAIDIVKYAYAVEGFKMKKGGVNKIIKNNAIYLSQEKGGLGITEESSILLSNLSSTDNLGLYNELRTNFIRSHANSKYVNIRKILSHKTNRFYDKDKTKPIWEKDLVPTTQGIIILNDVNLIQKYNIGRVENGYIVLNKFVILNNDGISTLYKINKVDSNVILTPLNTLEENEYSDMSINNDNNKYNTESWYNLVIEDYINHINQQFNELKELKEANASEEEVKRKIDEINSNKRKTFDASISALMAQADLQKYIIKDIDTSRYAKPFDINSKDTPYTSGFETVIDAVKERFEIEQQNILILRSPALKRFINYSGVLYGSVQTINGTDYIIQKGNYKKQNQEYINDKKEVREPNSDLNEIFKEAQRKEEEVNDAFIITKAPENYSSTLELSLEEPIENSNVDEYYNTTQELNTVPTVSTFNYKSIQTMYYRRRSLGDKRAETAIDYLNNKGINLTANELEAYKPIITQINSEYIVNTVNDIIKNINNFEINGESYRIDDDIVINAIKKDKKLQQKFLKTILDARAFVNTYSLIEQVDISSEDSETAKYLKNIKDAIGKLRSSNIIANAEIRMGNDVLAKLSDNPLIQKDILGVFDGYYSASLFDSWINDLQETSNPLLQIVSKQVISDINKEEMIAKRESVQFRKALNDIKARAARAGVNIDWNHIFDEDGKFIQKYNKAFLDKLQELRDKKEKAKLNKEENPKAYYKAALEFEKWKAENLNQEVDTEYYRQKIALEEFMIKHYAPIYIKYKTLINKRSEVYNHISGGILAQNYIDELDILNKEIDNLSSEFIFDGDTITEKYSYSDPNNPNTGENKAIYCSEAAAALNNYKKQLSELNSKYYYQESKKGFDKELENNLAIIREREKRDPNGHLLTPVSELMLDATYVRAKSWIANNTYFQHTSDKFIKLQQAFKILREAKDRDKTLNSKLVSTLAKRHKAYDEFGEINARLFTEEEIAEIKRRQEIDFGIKEQNVFSDRTLITNAPTDDTIFSSEFYDKMRSNGADNPEYIAKVNEINDILKDHYYPGTRTVHTSELTIDELNKLNTLYEELNNIKKHEEGTSTNGASIRQFMQTSVDYVYDDAKFAEEENRAKLRNQSEPGYYKKWLVVNSEIIEDENGNTKLIPNHYLYGYIVPKGYKKGEDNEYIDKDKTEALRFIRENTESVATEYYHQTYREMKAKGQDKFEKWFNANHIYNPYTHTIEPIRCWTTLKILGEDNKENYAPKYSYKERRPITGKNSRGEQLYDEEGQPIKDMRNSNYIKDGSYAQNYNGKNAQYNNTTPQNEYEKEISELIKNVIEKYTVTTQAKDFFKKGYAPIKQKDEEDTTKKIAKETVKLLGWINTSTGKEDWLDDNEVDYSKDRTITMPMTALLKSKESVDVKNNPPKRKENETDDEYKKRYEEWYNTKNEAIKHNQEIHRQLLDRNWEKVIEEFIIKASKFNAIQNNKYLLFYAKNMIDTQQIYVKNLGFNKLQKTGNRDITGSVEYVSKTDDNLRGQYINWVRRIVYEQYKKPNNRYTRVANILQSITSAKYMMGNYIGGIANITQGWNQVLGERFAKDYFGSKNWWNGVTMWNGNIGSFIYDMYKDNASSLGNAIVKFFGVVDQDSINGAPIIPDASTYISRARDITFSALSIGEHFLQNSALFAMLYSHRIYFDAEAEENGKPSYTFKSEGQVRNEAMDLAFREFIKDTKWEKLYDNFVKLETSKPDYKKEYVWYRKDFTSEFAYMYMSASDIKKFNEIRKQKENEITKEFENDAEHPTLMSQLDINKDGYLDFKNGSLLATKMTEEEAISFLASFKGRVVSVNKKIHGIYTQLGAARLENKWGGSLAMQYHKHIYPGILKRWRRQGYFNEERGTVEKGTNVALFDFLALPFRKNSFIKRLKADTNITDEQLKAVEGVQNICKNYVEFLTHFTLYFNLLPRYEQANILRGLADFASVVVALCTAVGLQCLGADDDDNGLMFDFFINQADRLASESMAFRSFGLVGEFKKLWSSPIAAQNLIEDTGKTLSLVAQYIMQGDEFEPEYTTGIYRGENKFEVLLKRNMPMYHSIYMLEHLGKNNKYYKLDQNMLSIIPTKSIAEWITK